MQIMLPKQLAVPASGGIHMLTCKKKSPWPDGSDQDFSREEAV